MKQSSITKIVGGLAVAAGAAVSAYALFIRPWHLKWGATEEEVRKPLPGDDMVPHPKIAATHAITICAEAEEVWPWLVQMGYGRGGLYSYDWIEDLAGLDIHSVNNIIPELQNLKVGDTLPLAPGGFGPEVVALEPNRYLLFHEDSRRGDLHATTLKPGDFVNASWDFYLEEVGPRMTRLIERLKVDYNPRLQNRLFYLSLFEPASFVMERKMLLGIKERAEANGEH